MMFEKKKIACVGSGVIGSSWATSFAMNGLDTVLYDIDSKYLDQARQRIARNLQYMQDNACLTPEQCAEALARITYTTSMEDAVSGAWLVQESGPENYDIKRSILAQIEASAPEDAIYASSTSGLLITEIARDALHPERCIGAHPFNPPHLIPLVEISKGERSSEDTVSRAKEFYQSIGKEPVVLHKETPGFIAGRLQIAVTREICELVMRGVCSVEDADKALTFGPGLRWGIMGPNLLLHLGGGEGGIDGLTRHLAASIKSWLSDMATWNEMPEAYYPIVRQGVEEEMAHRPAPLGNDVESITAYRDKMLIELLRLHGKL